MSDSIPVLDLAPLRDGTPGALDRLGEELRRAFTEVGFYFVRNHGIPQALLDETFAAAERFHAQPIEAKLALKINEHNIGYMPMRGATTRVNAVGEVALPNANEAIFFKRELPADHPDVVGRVRFRGLNQWPDLPGFRAQVLAACDAFEGLGLRLLPLYARALGLPADFFAPHFKEPMYTLRMSHYPQQAPTAPENEFGIAPHVDTSFMTILAQNRIPGLSLRMPGGDWVDAPAPEGALLINGGMMLRRWTDKRFLATPHRVINRSGQERYAIPFFMDAGYRAVMAPITEDGSAGREPPITYPDFMTGYQRSNFHHAADDKAEKVAMQGA
ncbi:isopenicillin N synthase family dioxygenase [Falsiroseomonas selenitidurans]|uniref:2-oxoglutarate-dependent ethylene/succinate-forming enzyme n=1 Tax=Falsiroseomonas selenitidurans TaxID=2716335 RepID=A0ABX1E6D7_9PROT|nr:isopenicillin N synthase family oxygenase [Falsiroseomonas selenitidurans]NKC31332.1 isopenicillin N synthase family oxygenase [Falsiroseomonas selenitidurans]